MTVTGSKKGKGPETKEAPGRDICGCVKGGMRIPHISEADRTPLVVSLLEIIHHLKKKIQALKDENAQLKGEKPRPKIKPSQLEKDTGKKAEKDTSGKRPGSAKRRKTADLKIHRTVHIRPENLPEGSTFKGFQDFTVQDMVLMPYNTRYRLERWELATGGYVIGKLPDEVVNGHYGVTLVSFVLYQYHHAHVTQPLIFEQLLEFGVDISRGQVNRMITLGKDCFHEEKEEILRVGLEISGHINVDDTGARHQGENGYCTHIGNELFAWFASTKSKSRRNFLSLLRGSRTEYVINPEALEYMRVQKLPKFQLERLFNCAQRIFADEAKWRAWLESMEITDERHIRIVTEGALLGCILEYGLINPALAIVSDDAGQFAILLHALCWIHMERTISTLVGFNDAQREALGEIRRRIWDFYDELKAYKQGPSEEKKAELKEQFDEIFGTKTCFQTLNQTLKRLAKRKKELLLVLDRPDIPLHNNTSERDIREYVKKRKISGSTRSDAGRRCRDTFTSLKKTSRKLGVSFWQYLIDRVSGKNTIPPLSDLMRWRVLQSPG